MSGKLILYHVNLSFPVRAVKIVARLLDIELELRDIDLLNGEHLKEPFVKLNPEHTVPTLIDGDFVIWDSHAICAYLVDKYGKDDSLYPKDLQLRAKCNQRMFFNSSNLFIKMRNCTVPILFKGCTEISQEKIDAINETYDILETFLASDPFLVGQNLTIADICIAGNILVVDIYSPLKSDKYPNITAWLERVNQTIPFFNEMHGKCLDELRQIILNKMKANKNKP